MKGKLFIFLGLLLITASVFLSGYNFLEQKRAGAAASEAVSELAEFIPSSEPVEETSGEETPVEESSVPDYILAPHMQMPVQTVDGIDYIGIIRIPSLGIELPVVSEWSYPALQVAPCRYSGSAYLENMVLCGHNYVSHFGNLRSLSPGDPVFFTDIDGNEFAYEVVELETLQSTAIEEMKSGEWALTLFTCTFDGASRVTVRCSTKE